MENSPTEHSQHNEGVLSHIKNQGAVSTLSEPSNYSKIPLYLGLFLSEQSFKDSVDVSKQALSLLASKGIAEAQKDLQNIDQWKFPVEPHITTLFLGKRSPKN